MVMSGKWAGQANGAIVLRSSCPADKAVRLGLRPNGALQASTRAQKARTPRPPFGRVSRYIAPAVDKPPAHRTWPVDGPSGPWLAHRSPAFASGLTRLACQTAD